jgi:hypothetical protein
MDEMESMEQVIRAMAEEFGEVPGWTTVLADALKELDQARSRKPPVKQQGADPHGTRKTISRHR